MSTEIYTAKNPNMPDASWLVFNCIKSEQRRARARFIKQFGREQYDQTIKPILRDGPMTIFHKPPTPQTAFYVNTLAEMVDRRTYPEGF